MKKHKKKKRTAKRQPVVQGYNPCLSPLIENIVGELPTPARLAYLSRSSPSSSPPPKGLLDFSNEILVTDHNASAGNQVVVASQFANVAFFRKYVGKVGRLVRRSEAPGGCGWIVDFGGELGRQFFSTGGSGSVCHLAFANTSAAASASLVEPSRSPMRNDTTAALTGWAVERVAPSESSLQSLIGQSRLLKSQMSSTAAAVPASEVCVYLAQSKQPTRQQPPAAAALLECFALAI